MTCLEILRGRDITLYKGALPLPGIVSVRLDEIVDGYDIMEYLCAEPCATVNKSRRYLLRVKALSLLDGDTFADDDYGLSLCSGGREYLLSGCSLRRRFLSAEPDDYAVYTYEISARRMEARDERG